MTRTLTIWASLIALSAFGVASCATPSYSTQAPIASQSALPSTTAPVSSLAPTTTPAPAATLAQTSGPPPSSPAPIDSQPLPPVTQAAGETATSLSPTPPPSPAQKALPPDYTPPTAEPAETSQPAPASTPPPIRYRTTPERVVAGGRVVAARGMFRDYVVQPKDHVDAIARDLQTTRKILVQANHLKEPYALKPGQHLKVPVAKAYEVQSGDTMAEVAKRFGVSLGELSDLNNLSSRARLHPGDMLALPEGFHDHGPTRIAAIEVAERPTEPRPVQPPARRPTAIPTPGPTSTQSPSSGQAVGGAPYMPSPEALAAAQRLTTTRSYGPPSYAQGRPTVVQSPPVSSTPPPEPNPAAQLAVANAGRGRFIWPVRGEIMSPFGVKGVGRRNDGIDIRAPEGLTVHAAAAGEVVYAGNQVPGFGNLVLVKHADGWVSAYAHLESIAVAMRQSVVQGDTLGVVGSTGGVAEPQLHFEIRYAPTPAEKARPVDPQLVLPK